MKRNMVLDLGKQDVKLLEAIDKALDDMKADGTYDEICQKWFAE